MRLEQLNTLLSIVFSTNRSLKHRFRCLHKIHICPFLNQKFDRFKLS